MLAAAMFTVPAAAETFTSSDGILSIELPSADWKQMTDPVTWIVLSDGANMITIDHLSNGERLPEMKIADDHYVNVYQVVFSTQNEVFIITGYVVDAAKIQEMSDAIVSTKILQLDTKLKASITPTQNSATEFAVVPADKTMYVTSNGLNVRVGCSTSDQIIGGYGYGSSVKVTGVMQKGGADFGWYQVNYEGQTGYVSASYLSDTAPAPKEDTQKKQSSSSTFTGNACTIYSVSGSALTIYEATNRLWYDSMGGQYTWIESNKLTGPDGSVYTTNKPASSGGNSLTPVKSFTVYWLNGNADTLTLYSDGNYYSSSWVMYFDAGGGAYAGADGTTLYLNVPQIGTAGSSLQHGLSSQGSGRPVEVQSNDGSVYYDVSGTLYYPQSDGTFIDSNGDVFNVEW